MTRAPAAPGAALFPYSAVVGQEDLKLALELSYVEPELGGVLISGERGTGKSTTVRAFARLMYAGGAVTLPINATEDRVIGGWKLQELVSGKAVEQRGLLEEADGKLLYVDEVNLLDDHIVNIILDVASTGELTIQREGLSSRKRVRFTLVGTMNPEEGALRPQLLDRFGLMVVVPSEHDQAKRERILDQVLGLERPVQRKAAAEADAKAKKELILARSRVEKLSVPDGVRAACVRLAREFNAEGHRGELVMARAARALAALAGSKAVELKHVRRVAALALRHRRKGKDHRVESTWTEADEQQVGVQLGED